MFTLAVEGIVRFNHSHSVSDALRIIVEINYFSILTKLF